MGKRLDEMSDDELKEELLRAYKSNFEDFCGCEAGAAGVGMIKLVDGRMAQVCVSMECDEDNWLDMVE